MTSQTIESQDLSIGSLFKDFYSVPSYQREYVWQDPQVQQLLEDVHEEYAAEQQTSEYFLGSIVVCQAPGGVFELIDGQQRMTTSYLLLCAVRDHLDEQGPSATPATIRNIIASQDIGPDGEDVFRYRVSLQYDDSCSVLETVAAKPAEIDGIQPSTRSVQNILNAYKCVRAFLRERFEKDDSGVKRFYAFFTNRVKMIRVKTASVAHALRVFETINDRGVGLDSMDLLKNLMFMSASPDEFDKLKVKWKTLVDTLFKAGEKPLRFLRYYIFADYGVERLREEEIYDWFVKNEKACGYKSKPLDFIERLISAAQAYVRFLAGNGPDGAANRYLTNISYMSGAARQHIILLLAGRHLSRDAFELLCRHVENLFFAYVITRANTREFERLFAQWTGEVRTIKNPHGVEKFAAKRFAPEKEKLATRFVLAFRELGEGSIQKYRLRYVLARLTQSVNERALGSAGAQVDLRTYINNKVEIEHILPQSPPPAVVEQFDKPGDLRVHVHRLGNLTLVEKTINCSIGNGTFMAKRKAYSQSAFLLTKSLSGKVVVGKATAIDKATRNLPVFESWTSADIERRQETLVQLALGAWEMPAPAAAKM